MPQLVPIQAIPNQSFTINLGTNIFQISIKSTNGIMSISMIINNVDTIDNIRMVAGSPLIPSQYEEAGNFLLQTANFALPDYMQFNLTQQLIYLTADELAALRSPVSPPLTPVDFNPLGALPLRFSPTGYTAAM